jgi:hypothetical protein
MMTKALFASLMVAMLMLAACNMPTGSPVPAPTATNAGSDDLGTLATATPTELPDDLALPPGQVSGQLCYPSEFIPPMTLYFLEIGSDELTSVDHASGEQSYSLELPAGTYYAFAFRSDVEMNGGGGYTDYIACGAADDCGGQDLHAFDVPAGGEVTGIDICDWVIPVDQLPPVPEPTQSIDDLSSADGEVTGSVCYPSEGIPPMVLHFFEIDSQQTIDQSHAQSDADYNQALPPGTYYAYANVDLDDFVGDDGGGYTEWVACGQDVSCTDHSLRAFDIETGQTTSGIDICDWFLPAEDLPGASGTPAPIDDLAPLPTPTDSPPRGGISLNCDGTYQRLRIVDNGPDGKTVYVDRWQGGAWVNAWSKTPQDPFLQHVQDEAGWYEFGGCQKLVIVPILNGNPQVTLDLTVYAWNGATMSQVYGNSGWYGTWSKIGDTIRTREATKLGGIDGGPLTACEWPTLEYTWDGSAFQLTGSNIEVVDNCEVTVTDHP